MRGNERCNMHIRNRFLTTAATAAVLLTAASASAATDPRGVWIDHTGRGAVEITDCEGELCGRVVWLKDASNAEACGVQILGNVKPAGSGVWDKGWIYDPEQDAKFSVELKPLGPEKLRVKGYLGTKLFSETMIWERAPADLQRCSTGETTAALSPPAPPAASEQTAPAKVDEAARSAPEQPPAPGKEAAAKPVQPTPAAPAAKAEGKRPDGQVAESKPKPQNCKLEVPYFTLSFPCPD